MNTTVPAYIGITDFTDPAQVRACLGLVPERATRRLHVGVMTSYKFLNAMPTKWADVWSKRKHISSIFVRDPRLLNVLHYADYDGATQIEDLYFALNECGPNVDAIQLDMVWPAPRLVKDLCEMRRDVKVILQVGARALEEISNIPKYLLRKIADYDGNIHAVLLDRSMGKGITMDPALLKIYIKPISDIFSDIPVVVAGGLGPGERLSPLREILEEFPEVSWDAQTQLHFDSDPMKPVDWEGRAYRYLADSYALSA